MKMDLQKSLRFMLITSTSIWFLSCRFPVNYSTSFLPKSHEKEEPLHQYSCVRTSDSIFQKHWHSYGISSKQKKNEGRADLIWHLIPSISGEECCCCPWHPQRFPDASVLKPWSHDDAVERLCWSGRYTNLEDKATKVRWVEATLFHHRRIQDLLTSWSHRQVSGSMTPRRVHKHLFIAKDCGTLVAFFCSLDHDVSNFTLPSIPARMWLNTTDSNQQNKLVTDWNPNHWEPKFTFCVHYPRYFLISMKHYS